ncbi:hypothetical protein ANCCEY_04636 [Ancylostoma ceylanicum]|uniref:Uncharacterized protein n=1 Tax=Ancylostoma ceylanicum TaxID=53326 RepID=A0A0D6LWU9_9BILA|nr:hypothetical protein ANCCEY_04636 [Ancylostoma ceylanicum]
MQKPSRRLVDWAAISSAEFPNKTFHEQLVAAVTFDWTADWMTSCPGTRQAAWPIRLHRSIIDIPTAMLLTLLDRPSDPTGGSAWRNARLRRYRSLHRSEQLVAAVTFDWTADWMTSCPGTRQAAWPIRLHRSIIDIPTAMILYHYFHEQPPFGVVVIPTGIYAKVYGYKNFKRRETEPHKWRKLCDGGQNVQHVGARNGAQSETRETEHVKKAKIDKLQSEKREVELELMKTKSALHKLVVQNSISQNRSFEIPEVTVERIDEECDVKPELFTEGVQTDDDPLSESLEMTSSTRSLHGSRVLLTQRERKQLEERCTELQTQLTGATEMIAELEEVKQAMTEEIAELKRSYNENIENSRAIDNSELTQVRAELADALAEVERLREENAALKQVQDTTTTDTGEKSDTE